MTDSAMKVHLQSVRTGAGCSPLHIQPYKVIHIAISVAIIMVLLILFLADVQPAPNVDESRVTLFGVQLPCVCIDRQLLGRPCPTCGVTRGVISLLDGNAEAAAKFHPSAIWILLWMVTQVGVRLGLVHVAAKKRLPWSVDLSLSLVTMIACVYLPLVWS